MDPNHISVIRFSFTTLYQHFNSNPGLKIGAYIKCWA